MSNGILTIDLAALVANWQAMDAACNGKAGAVVKADGYGLGAGRVAQALAGAGARRFFVASCEEGAALRAVIGPDLPIHVFSGHMAGDAALIGEAGLIPMLNSPEQARRHLEALPGAAYGVQLDSGMNRLGLEPQDWAALRGDLADAQLIMSHLAVSDEPGHPGNAAQRAAFEEMTAGCTAPRSLSATGGILLGKDYHYDITRPGIGVYGGLPFASARPVVRLSLPVIQTRIVAPGEGVGYGYTRRAAAPMVVATLAGGYADGILRALSGKARLFHGDLPCPLAGRVSMDLLTVDVTHLETVPETLDLLCPAQGVDALASEAGTIGYEILTSLGARYQRRYL